MVAPLSDVPLRDATKRDNKSLRELNEEFKLRLKLNGRPRAILTSFLSKSFVYVLFFTDSLGWDITSSVFHPYRGTSLQVSSNTWGGTSPQASSVLTVEHRLKSLPSCCRLRSRVLSFSYPVVLVSCRCVSACSVRVTILSTCHLLT